MGRGLGAGRMGRGLGAGGNRLGCKSGLACGRARAHLLDSIMSPCSSGCAAIIVTWGEGVTQGEGETQGEEVV